MKNFIIGFYINDEITINIFISKTHKAHKKIKIQSMILIPLNIRTRYVH